MNQGKKPRPQIGTTRAHEFSSQIARERASMDNDPYNIGGAKSQQFKMKRFADVQSKVPIVKVNAKIAGR